MEYSTAEISRMAKNTLDFWRRNYPDGYISDLARAIINEHTHYNTLDGVAARIWLRVLDDLENSHIS